MPDFHIRLLFTNDGPPLTNVLLSTDTQGFITGITSPVGDITADRYCGVVVPGFVNSHTHLELSHLRGLIRPREEGMSGFIRQLLRVRQTLPEDEQVRAMHRADLEMYEEGIVAVGDIANTHLSLDTKMNSNLYYHTFVELLGFGEQRAPQLLALGKQCRDLYAGKSLAASITPHAIYSLSSGLLDGIIALQTTDYPMTVHMHESEEELQFCRDRSGSLAGLFEEMKIDFRDFEPMQELPPVLYFLRRLPPGLKVQLVHNTVTDAETMQLAAQYYDGLYWCFCPSANLYITGGLPDINTAYHNRYTVCIGTDSLASNEQLSMLQELKLIAKHFPALPFEFLLHAATWNGALLLGIEDRFGKIKPGCRPGLVELTGINPENPGWHDAVKAARIDGLPVL